MWRKSKFNFKQGAEYRNTGDQAVHSAGGSANEEEIEIDSTVLVCRPLFVGSRGLEVCAMEPPSDLMIRSNRRIIKSVEGSVRFNFFGRFQGFEKYLRITLYSF